MSRRENPRLILGLKLRTLRQRRGETLQETAERAGFSVSYLSEVEKGRKYPKVEKLQRLAEALEVPFDELVSLKVDEELEEIKTAIGSQLLREFPFELFGFEPGDVFRLMAGDPGKGGALVRALLEVGRTYDLHVEQFLLAALRSYQQMHANYFADLEDSAARFRAACGWDAGTPVAPADLEAILGERWNYEIDRRALTANEHLAGFRTVFSDGGRPRLYLNERLMPSQQAFALGREIGYRHLGLGERAVSSSWLRIESFDQILNNFKASYFSGALLLDRATVEADAGAWFDAPIWSPAPLLAAMRRFDATPETYLTRLTQLVPKRFGFEELFFLRFNHRPGAADFELTKWLNMSRLQVPYGITANEHFCRRWPALELLASAGARTDPGAEPAVSAQRSRFLDDEAEFFVVAVMRPLALTASTNSCVTLGFLLDDEFERRVRFADDPALPRLEVNRSCERCTLEDCDERAAPAEVVAEEALQRQREVALDQLLEG